MRTTCLINHYNYGEFVGEAVSSALAQTHPLDEIILVDDGSSEEHLALAKAAAAQSDLVQLVNKPNGGQLSCFQAGLEASDGDLVFFLDGDDRWTPNYVQRVVELLRERPEVDFVATNQREFSAEGTKRVEGRPSRDRGKSLVLCLEKGGVWVGAPTSCLAIRRPILKKIFPVPNPEGWRVCADEALVYGSSIANAHKYFLGEPLVEYRIHDNNSFFNKKDTPERAFSRRLEGRRLVEHMRLKLALPQTLIDLVHYEFRTIEEPTREDFQAYMSIVLKAAVPLMRKLRLISDLMRTYYFRSNI
jgi:glycosyltransferase involved in cell wall biosynthesis